MYENVRNLPQSLKRSLVTYSGQFEGIGTLCGKSGNIRYMKVNIESTAKPVAQKYRLPPANLKEKLLKGSGKWEDAEATYIGPITEKLPNDEPTTLHQRR